MGPVTLAIAAVRLAEPAVPLSELLAQGRLTAAEVVLVAEAVLSALSDQRMGR